jgi:hypothetical protein
MRLTFLAVCLASGMLVISACGVVPKAAPGVPTPNVVPTHLPAFGNANTRATAPAPTVPPR